MNKPNQPVLKVVEFLRQFSSSLVALSELKDKYAIQSNQHKDYPNLVQLKYNQLESPMSEKIVQECRGLILDSSQDWEVIAYPMNKFFNYNEHKANFIDWSTAFVWDKVDGSLMFLYHYDKKFHVASSSLPDASGRVSRDPSNLITYKELFWQVWKELNYSLPKETNFTYVFELATPMNQVIVPLKTNRIVYLAKRNIETFDEHPLTDLNGWELPQRFPVTSLNEAVDLCENLNPMSQEGFVVVDSKFNRVKMKSPQYVAISHLGLTEEEIIDKNLSLEKLDKHAQRRWMLKIIMTNECDEFLTYYPQYTKLYHEVKESYDYLLDNANQIYNENQHLEERAKFAKSLQGHPLMGVMFALRDGKVKSIEDGVRSMGEKKLYKLIGGVVKNSW